MEKMVLILHIVICVLLIVLVLLQSGKEGMGVIFGGGNTSLFGSSGAGGILVKLTTFAAIIFLVTSLGYNILSSSKFKHSSTILEMVKQDPFRATPPAAQPAAPASPAVPATPATPAGNTTAN